MDRLNATAALIAEKLKARGETIAVAESSTGGLISAALLAVPGASKYYLGGGVIYTRDARRELLGLPEDVVTMRAATEDYAAIIAKAMREKFSADWAVSETGASGPTGNRYGDAAGHSCFAVSGHIDDAMTIETGLADREENMWRFAAAALQFLDKTIGEAG